MASGVWDLTSSVPSMPLGALSTWLPGQAVSKATETTSIISGSSSITTTRILRSCCQLITPMFTLLLPELNLHQLKNNQSLSQPKVNEAALVPAPLPRGEG